MTNINRLTNCPYCKEKGNLEKNPFEEYKDELYREVYCTNCGYSITESWICKDFIENYP